MTAFDALANDEYRPRTLKPNLAQYDNYQIYSLVSIELGSKIEKNPPNAPPTVKNFREIIDGGAYQCITPEPVKPSLGDLIDASL
jgi:hypothetical protein